MEYMMTAEIRVIQKTTDRIFSSSVGYPENVRLDGKYYVSQF